MDTRSPHLPGTSPLLPAALLRRLEAAHAAQPLMARAGEAAARWAEQLRSDSARPVLVLAGPGNNGGDAFVCATRLREADIDVVVVSRADPARLSADAQAARQAYLDGGGAIAADLPVATPWGLIVDGLFGIGLARDLAAPYAAWTATAQAQARRDHCPILALDVPSGLDADTGRAWAGALQATHTLTFLADKPGLHTADGPDLAGEVRIAELGVAATAWAAAASGSPNRAASTADDAHLLHPGRLLAPADFAPWLKPRPKNSHKGRNGEAGILGGAPGMTGAALLAGRAALLLGAGRTFVGCLDPQAPAVDIVHPELMLRRGEALLATPLSALAVGPGLGQDDAARRGLATALGLAVPLVLDADALNLVAREPQLAAQVAARNPGRAPTLLTPHPAEAARLLASDTAAIQADRIAAARTLAARFNAHVALKGCGTVLAHPPGSDGNDPANPDGLPTAWAINPSGNPGMSTAGMGDVLSGIVVALLAQGWPPGPALEAAVHLHGAAADALVAAGTGPVGLTAGETIPAARSLLNRWIGATLPLG